MNRAQLRGDWNVMKGKVKQQWGKLTDDDISQINGQREELIGRLQKAYGRAREDLEKEVDRWEDEADRGAAPGRNRM